MDILEISRPSVDELVSRYGDRTATVAVIGLGYVGLPLVSALVAARFDVVGFDVDPDKIAALKAGRSYIKHLPADPFLRAIKEKHFHPTTNVADLEQADAILICVPTPLTRHREPDLTFVTSSSQTIASILRPGQLIVLESTTYPGTTRDVIKPILEQRGLECGRDFFLAYSPEREDPGNSAYSTAVIPKVVAGDGPDALRLVNALYCTFVSKTVQVPSLEVAEAVKLT